MKEVGHIIDLRAWVLASIQGHSARFTCSSYLDDPHDAWIKAINWFVEHIFD
jgi:hypothetical protein